MVNDPFYRLSIFLAHLFVAVLGIRNEPAAIGVNDEVEVFQRDLTHQIGSIFISLDNFEGPMRSRRAA